MVAAGRQAGMTATISIVRGLTITISSPTRKYSKPRHAGWISTMVVGTGASLMLRGTATPTLSWKSTRETRGALRSDTITWWIFVRCSVVRLTETLVLLVVPAVPRFWFVVPGWVDWL